MNEAYLEVTYRHGRALAAYYYLPRKKRARSVRTRRAEPGLIIDFSAKGEPLGIEITAPALVRLASFNSVLRELGLPPVEGAELAPCERRRARVPARRVDAERERATG